MATLALTNQRWQNICHYFICSSLYSSRKNFFLQFDEIQMTQPYKWKRYRLSQLQCINKYITGTLKASHILLKPFKLRRSLLGFSKYKLFKFCKSNIHIVISKKYWNPANSLDLSKGTFCTLFCFSLKI